MGGPHQRHLSGPHAQCGGTPDQQVQKGMEVLRVWVGEEGTPHVMVIAHWGAERGRGLGKGCLG